MTPFDFLLGLGQGLAVYVIGGVLLLLFILPRLSAASAKATIHQFKQEPEVKKLLKQLEELNKRVKAEDIDLIVQKLKKFLG